jgi:NAD(P)-dependent dehydrogenase (short-subunit alcohol dehydrogenase family)
MRGAGETSMLCPAMSHGMVTNIHQQAVSTVGDIDVLINGAGVVGVRVVCILPQVFSQT